MRKIAKSLLVLIIALCLAFSVGCNFILTPDDLTNGNDNNGYTDSALAASFWGRGKWENEKLSSELNYSVNFAAGSRAAYEDYATACAELDRACVAITLQESPTATSATYGSGTIINVTHDGKNSNEYYILTCHHVVDGCGYITVYVPDEERDNFTDGNDYDTRYAFTGRIGNLDASDDAVPADSYGVISLVGGDLVSDVAVLKLTLNDNVSAALKPKIVGVNLPRSTYSIAKGEEVFAIGNPTGTLPGTFSVGHISYMNRDVALDEIGNMSLGQMNVDIYPGSSGGALFNKYGELIGITNAGNTQDPGINYFIPYESDLGNGFIDIARQLIATKLEYPLTYGFVSGHNVRLGITLSINGDNKVYVASVEKNSLAEASGIKTGDVILAVNGYSISKPSDIGYFIANGTFGEPLQLSIKRGGIGYNVEIPLWQFHFCDTGAYGESTQPAA